MQYINSVIQSIIENGSFSKESLAVYLQVNPSTVARWLKGQSVPRPDTEGKLRKLDDYLQSVVKDSGGQLSFFDENTELKIAISTFLREIREILHRRGRLSSRNEALDEVSKILFAHIISIIQEDTGISKQTLAKYRSKNVDTAESLQHFIKAVFKKYLPKSLSHEMLPSDFALKIKSQENILAEEIIACLDNFIPKSLIKECGRVDILNDFFGQFLADSFVDEKQLGQYLTPTEVVNFMVQLALQNLTKEEFSMLCDPQNCKNFGFIMDPSCGVGSFLTEIIRTVYYDVEKRFEKDLTAKWLQSVVKHVIVGIDKSERMMRLALTNMAMFGLPMANLHLNNALSRQKGNPAVSLEGKVKLILTNPPFGAEFSGRDLNGYKIARKWSKQVPKKVNSELLFVERYLDWLMPGGQFLAIVPDSILTNRGLFRDLREGIANQIEIRSIISLPNETFGAAGTNTKTSILHIRKCENKSNHPSATFFALCKNVGYSVETRETQKYKRSNGKGDLPKILSQYNLSEIDERYIRRVDNVEKAARWDASYHASLPIKIEKRLKNPSPSDIYLSEVAELSTERTDPRRWGKETFQYIEISDINSEAYMFTAKPIRCAEAPSRARKIIHAGDILFSTVRPDRRTIGVVREEQDGAVCTTGFAVIKPKEIDPLVLAYLLRSDFVTAQVLRNNIGIAYPAIDESCLPDILLPIARHNLHNLQKYSSKVFALEEELRNYRSLFAEHLEIAINTWKGTDFNPVPTLHQ